MGGFGGYTRENSPGIWATIITIRLSQIANVYLKYCSSYLTSRKKKMFCTKRNVKHDTLVIEMVWTNNEYHSCTS